MEAFEIKQHQRQDDHKIFELQRLVYPDHPLYRNAALTEKYWQWRYFSNPSINSYVYVATVNGGRTIAGMRPMSIVPIKVGERKLKALWLTAVITHPAFRKQGIFSALVKHSMQQAKELGADFAYTFPNQNSYPIYQNKPEWQTLANIPVLAKVLNYPRVGYQLFSRLLGASEPREETTLELNAKVDPIETDRKAPIQLHLATRIDQDHTELWEDVYKDVMVALPRHAEYLRWRYLDNPVLQYEIIEARNGQGRLEGYIVTGVQRRHRIKLGLIVDLLFRRDAGEAARLALRESLRRLKVQGADMVCALWLNNHLYQALMAHQGFWRLPKSFKNSRVNLITSIIKPSMEAIKPKEMHLNFDNWFVTWGDTDNA